MLFGHVAIGHLIADPLGTDAAGVVLHHPVQDIQLDGSNTCAAHVAVGIGNEAAILRPIACRRHLHPQGVGGCVAAGQVFKVVGSRSTAQPLIAQVRAFRFNNEGCNVARSSVVIIRFIDDGKFRFKLAEGGYSAGDGQPARLGRGNMPHIVLGDTAVEVSVDAGLNGNAQSGGGAAADVAPSLPIVGAALPLVSYPIAAGCHSKGGGAA